MKILAINPGSTSTKVAVYSGIALLAEKTIRHSVEETSQHKSILDQRDMRKAHVLSLLEENDIDPKSLSAVVGRGGLLKPIESGTYGINDAMLADLKRASAAVHASSLGGISANENAKDYGLRADVVQPIVVEKMEA